MRWVCGGGSDLLTTKRSYSNVVDIIQMYVSLIE